MKIVGIQSSPRGKNSITLKLLKAAMDGASEAGAETDIIDITKLKIKFCKGCVSCYRLGECVQKDDYKEVYDKLMEADGVIMTSPNYVDNVTGQMKVMLDRSTNFIHEQLLDGKYGFSITTAGGGGCDIVLNMLNTFITKSGGYATGSVGLLASEGPKGMEAAIKRSKEMGNDLAVAIKDKRPYPGQEATHKAWRKSFTYALTWNKDHWKHNYERWISKGWIKG